MRKREVIVPLTQHGCQAGLVLADNETLDNLVTEGIRARHLVIGERTKLLHRVKDVNLNGKIRNLDEYLTTYGSLLGRQAERSLQPLHIPGQCPLPTLKLMRTPFEAQQHVIEAARQALHRQKSILLVGEMGTGKTIMGLSAIHAHAGGRSYRALVFCPGQLINKWEREIRETIPGAEVIQIESWKSLLSLNRTEKPTGVRWYIIARDRAKLGAKWQPAYQERTNLVDGFLRCPHCGRRLVDEKREPLFVGKPGKEGHSSVNWYCPATKSTKIPRRDCRIDS